MAVTNKLNLETKKTINNNINSLFNGCYYKDNRDNEITDIYSYLKILMIEDIDQKILTRFEII